MIIHRSVAVALIAAIGIAGAYVGRFVPRDASSALAPPTAPPAPSPTGPAGKGCEAERDEIAPVQAQLAFCLALGAWNSETKAPDAPEPSDLDRSSDIEPRIAAEIRRVREQLDSLPEAVIVQHADGTIGYHKPDESPIDGDGLIIGRKFPDGQIGWYAGPDAGSRSDPAAFRPTQSTIVLAPNVVREADGAIRVRRDAPPWVKRRLGGEVDEPAEP
ncbi:hypothetical protein [Sorangium cellulosum]|uniref:hypothetical protein n=1 Tax=Sorangium cellulosum TaxID=56 RepID=UPI0010135624|nr:hypothetical protein [Sorangium cellulosum]